jgi:hypothetical protein
VFTHFGKGVCAKQVAQRARGANLRPFSHALWANFLDFGLVASIGFPICFFSDDL